MMTPPKKAHSFFCAPRRAVFCTAYYENTRMSSTTTTTAAAPAPAAGSESWAVMAGMSQLAADVQQLKDMIGALTQTQQEMSNTLKRAREDNATEAPKKKRKPRPASEWMIAVRLAQHLAKKLEPVHRKDLMRWFKAHRILQDPTFAAFLAKHVDKSKPQDNDFVDNTMLPAMEKECKAMVKKFRGLKPADLRVEAPTADDTA